MTPLLVVDGYNIIGQWKRAAQKGWGMDQARDELAHRLTEYAAYEGVEVVLVFDALLSDRLTRTEEKQGNLTVVFTRQGESADQYIERLVDQTPRRREVRVATSDALEQTIVLGRGAVRIPGRELLRDMAECQRQQRAKLDTPPVKAYPIYQRLPQEQRDALEKLRREK